MNIIWNNPEKIPEVKLWDEELFWVAVDSRHTGKIHTFLAYYQNRPLPENDYDECEDCLVSCDGEMINSVGWVGCKEHTEFENYYEAIDFSSDYVLLGWADYTPPEFTGIKPHKEQ